MQWECCECGERLDRALPPNVCTECGLAGGKFVLAAAEVEDEELRAAWMRAGFEQRRLPVTVARR